MPETEVYIIYTIKYNCQNIRRAACKQQPAAVAERKKIFILIFPVLNLMCCTQNSVGDRRGCLKQIYSCGNVECG